MSEPEQIGGIIDFAAMRKRMLPLLRDREEIDERDRELARIKRQMRTVGPRLNALVDWPAIKNPDVVVPDADSAQGVRWARRFRAGDQGVVLWGQRGTGKTTLCCRLLRRLEADGRTCALVSAPGLISAMISESWHRNALLGDIRDVDVLVLDDMGAGTWQRGWGGHLWAIADARWQARRRGDASTIITTNLDPRSEHAFGWEVTAKQDINDWERTQDRLRAMVGGLIEYGGQSRRGRA